MHSADHGCWGICGLLKEWHGDGGELIIVSCSSSYYLLLEGSQPEYLAGTGRHALFISFTKTSSKTDGPCISRTGTVIMGLENVGSFQLTPRAMVVLTVGLFILPHDVCMSCPQCSLQYRRPAGRLNQVSWLLLAPAGWSPVHFPFRYTACLWHHSLRFDLLHASLVGAIHSNEIQYIDPACTSIIRGAYCGANRASHIV